MNQHQIAPWRRVLFTAGLVLILIMWSFALLQSPVAGEEITSIFGTTAGTFSWSVLVVAMVFFLVAYYGTQPDSFLVLVPLGVTVNIVGGIICSFMELPFFGNTVGTMISAIVGGPALGVVTALATSVIWGIATPFVVPHALSAVLAALVVGGAVVSKRISTVARVMLVGLGLGLINAGLSWLTVEYALDEYTTNGIKQFADFFLYLHHQQPMALFFHAAVCVPLEMILSLYIATVSVRFSPKVVQQWLTYWGNKERLACILSGSSATVRPPEEADSTAPITVGRHAVVEP